MSQKAALFDLDGVLIDTEGVYYRFWDDVEKKYPTGIPDYASYIKGNTLKRIMNYYPDPAVRADIIAMLKEQEENMRYELFDGVENFLKELNSRNIPCAIVTSSNSAKLEHVFEQLPGFSDYFDAVLTDRDVLKSKPDPEGYCLAASRLGHAAGDCVVFEDSFAGLEAGRRSGARVVALATTNSADTLVDKADMVVPSFVGLSVDEVFGNE